MNQLFKRWMIILLLVSGLMACSPAQPMIPTTSPLPPPIPTDPRLTPTASATPTDTPTATRTYPPLTASTPTLTRTLRPIDTSHSSGGISATRRPATLQPSGGSQYTGQFYNIGPYLRQLYEYGQSLGNDRHHFITIGDCHSTAPEFLRPFDAGDYNLGGYTYLDAAITHFEGSFEHIGLAALDGLSINTLLDPDWSDPKFCFTGENRIECEYRLYKPAIALIFSPPMVVDGWQDAYYQGLKGAVELSLERGVIPVLTTYFQFMDHPELTDETNAIIRRVAEEYRVPLWDFYATSYALPEHGDRGNWHLTISNHSSTDFGNADSMTYGMSLRNLEALQVLHLILNEVME